MIRTLMHQDRNLRRKDIFKRVQFELMIKFKRSQSTQSIILYKVQAICLTKFKLLYNSVV